MLKIINNLGPFFEDCYDEIGVREYSRLVGVSPPTASKLLKNSSKEKFLNFRKDKGYFLFRANRENEILREFSRIYWKIKLSELISYLELELNFPTIILFGSLSKLEAKKESDIDIAVITTTKKKLNFNRFEKKFKRNIQIFYFDSLDKIKTELKKNILNGYFLKGEIL